MNVDIDIHAGEESASTEGIIELEMLEYTKSESTIGMEEDFMAIDIIMEEMKQEDGVEAIMPESPSVKAILL